MRRNVEGRVDDFPDGEDFWLNASQSSLDSIWDNSEDDIYAALLETSMSRSGENDSHVLKDN